MNPITQGDRDVGGVSEFRCRNGRVFKRRNERGDLAVAGETSRSQ